MSLSLCRKRPSGQSVPSTQASILESETPSGSQPKRRRNENSMVTARRGLTHRATLNLTQGSDAFIRCGKIIKISLTNFMCHSNLCVDLHSRVNFLVGSNGSGKSAVLAAVVLGMGGRAKITNRSENLKQLIKTGENSAKIEITLSNEGPEAFETEIYGDRITVIRNITHSSASYTIKSANGRVVSRKVDDLHRILMYHNVQVDNPVFVLNQDSAREFLKELIPSKNYSLFLKATQIESIMKTLNECLFANKDLKNRILISKKRISQHHEEVGELKDKLTQLSSLEKIKDKLHKKELEHLWLLVSQLELQLQKHDAQIKYDENVKTKLERMVQKKEEVEQELTQKITDYEKEIQIKNDSYIRVNLLCAQLKTKVRNMSVHCVEIQSDIVKCKKRVSFLQTQINELKVHIEDHSRSKLDNIAETRRRNEANLTNLHSKKKENLAIIASTKRDLGLFIDSRMQKEERVHEVQRKKKTLNDKIRSLNDQMVNIRSSSRNNLSIYGEHVPSLIVEIKKYFSAGRFSELPLGPIGCYVEVPESKYRDVVENQIGRLLEGFIVNNTNDRLVFTEILEKNFSNYHPVVITMNFFKKIHDVRQGRVNSQRGTKLLMDVIKCRDPVVMNCLIDRIQVETILLTDTKDIAEHITSNHENVPQHLTKVIVLHHGLEYYPEPKYRMYSLKILSARFIHVNVEDRLWLYYCEQSLLYSKIKSIIFFSQLEMEKGELQQSVQVFDNEVHKLSPEVQSCIKLTDEKRKLLERYEVTLQELQEKIIELESYEYPEYNEVDVLKKELSENERKRMEVEQKLNQKICELSKEINDKNCLENNLIIQEEAMQRIQQEINTIKNKKDETKLELRNVADNYRSNQSKLQEFKEKIQHMEQTKILKERDVAAATEEAQKKGDQVRPNADEEQLLSDIQKLNAELKHRAKISEDPKMLKDLIAGKECTIQKDKEMYDSLKTSIDKLRQSLLRRFDFVKKLKQHMVLLLQFTFNNILKLRNFVGYIEVDHHERTLAVSVIPRDKHLETAVSNTRALSGGERSYSTVAFLIALWSCVDHPFYFLDEYDVFTDEVNREYMTRLLITEGKRRPNRQYTFLSPQDMSVKAEDFIQIHRLSEPDRR